MNSISNASEAALHLVEFYWKDMSDDERSKAIEQSSSTPETAMLLLIMCGNRLKGWQKEKAIASAVTSPKTAVVMIEQFWGDNHMRDSHKKTAIDAALSDVETLVIVAEEHWWKLDRSQRELVVSSQEYVDLIEKRRKEREREFKEMLEVLKQGEPTTLD